MMHKILIAVIATILLGGGLFDTNAHASSQNDVSGMSVIDRCDDMFVLDNTLVRGEPDWYFRQSSPHAAPELIGSCGGHVACERDAPLAINVHLLGKIVRKNNLQILRQNSRHFPQSNKTVGHEHFIRCAQALFRNAFFDNA